ncbi:MAG TPA: hypothetical protein VIQ81_13645 [Gammaproteobacteria bacterium]
MTIGTGIFLSTLLVCTIYLCIKLLSHKTFSLKKSLIAILKIIIPISVFVIGVVFAFNTYKDRVVKQIEFNGIKLGQSKSDILFTKGKPDIDRDTEWVYTKSSIIRNSDQIPELIVQFKSNAVDSIVYMGNCYSCYEISGIGLFDSYESVTRKFGSPSYISISKDQTERILSYSNYNTFFQLRENRVNAFGIFNGNSSEFKFSSEHSK